jgi:hypothetical protein
MRNLPALDIRINARHMSRDILDEPNPFVLAEHSIEKSCLFKVVGAIRPGLLRSPRISVHHDRCFGQLQISNCTAATVWRIVRFACSVSIDSHGAVALVIRNLARVRTIDRY